MREYDLIADWYAAERVDTAVDGSGVPEAVALAHALGPGARVLDIGCGHGIPITKALLHSGLQVVGIDSSPKMLARFRTNLPATIALRGVAQALPFADRTFDAALAWGVMFHLPPAEENQFIASVARVLKPGGSFLFTAGYPTDADADGERGDAHVDTMNGVDFHYYTFTQDGYRRVLAEHGLTLVDFHTDAGQNGYYFAKRTAR